MTKQKDYQWLADLLITMERATHMEEKLKQYLDESIIKWREKKLEAETEYERHTATCYVDAFQSVRQSMLGELLPQRQL